HEILARGAPVAARRHCEGPDPSQRGLRGPGLTRLALSHSAFRCASRVESIGQAGHNAEVPTDLQEGATMSILPDWQIKRDVKIEPFEESLLRPGVISYGVSSYGYDVRVGRKFKIFTNALCAVVDPKNFDSRSFVDVEADHCLIPPNSFA